MKKVFVDGFQQTEELQSTKKALSQLHFGKTNQDTETESITVSAKKKYGKILKWGTGKRGLQSLIFPERCRSQKRLKGMHKDFKTLGITQKKLKSNALSKQLTGYDGIPLKSYGSPL